MIRPILSITQASLACPLGLYSAAALAAARAGLTRFERLDDPAVTISRLSRIDARLGRGDRMQALLCYALTELGQCPPPRYAPALPIFLALPDEDSGSPYDERALLAGLRTEIVTRLGREPLFPPHAVVRRGRAGLVAALQRAVTFLTAAAFPDALVGAVDSLVDPGSISLLDAQHLLLGDHNLDGRIASEAAGFFLVSQDPAAAAQGRILALAEEQDTAHSFMRVQAGATINTAPGLTRLFRQLGTAFSTRTQALFSAQPGEGYWGREFSYAYLRNVAWMPEPLRMKAVGTIHGDAGAAAGALAFLHALASFHPRPWSHQPPTHRVFFYGVSDHGELGACALAAS